MSIFSKIQKTHVKSNIFDLTHDRKMSGKMGKLMPIMVMDCVPGDKISIKSNVFVRFAPLIAPVMHRVKTYCHFFFVPNRLTWPNWEDFITGGEDGQDTTVHPYFQVNMAGSGIADNSSLWDYMGLPTYGDTLHGGNVQVNPLPFAAYQLIWNEYYRDQNLQDNIKDDIQLNDGVNSISNYIPLRERAWQHDYFTSALPWTQKGPEAMLPLGDTAPIEIYEDKWGTGQMNQQYRDGGTGTGVAQDPIYSGPIGSDLRWQDDEAHEHGVIDLNNTHYTDLSSATASSINDLRRAFKLQEWLEKNARGGSRYIESIAVHFGVNSSDRRLQRPEFLGGTSVPVKISEVLQMSNAQMDPSTGDPISTPQGTMAGHGVSIGSGDYVSHFCEEHGYIIGIMSIMPMSAYQQGIPKHFLRRDKFDYYWPEFAHIGEQAIQNQELYVRADNLEETFGYTPRYVEYKFINNSVHGDFRSTLDFWHMGRKFTNSPALNESFIKMEATEVDRIFAVRDGSDNMWCHVLNEVKAQRKMPIFGTPKM